MMTIYKVFYDGGIIAGFYKTQVAADSAVSELVQMGYPEKDIKVTTIQAECIKDIFTDFDEILQYIGKYTKTETTVSLEFDYLCTMARAWNKFLGFNPNPGEIRYYPTFATMVYFPGTDERLSGVKPGPPRFMCVHAEMSVEYSPFGPFIAFGDRRIAMQFGEAYIDHFQKFLVPWTIKIG